MRATVMGYRVQRIIWLLIFTRIIDGIFYRSSMSHSQYFPCSEGIWVPNN